MGPVRIQRDVIRIDQRPCDISKDNEPDTIERDRSNMPGIPRRYFSILTRHGKPFQRRIRSVLSTGAKWRPFKMEKM